MELRKSILGKCKRIVLCHSNEGRNNIYTIMEGITEKQEAFIDELVSNKRRVYFETAYKNIIDQRNIVSYGEININNPENREFIIGKNLVNSEGNIVPSCIDYENAEEVAVNNSYLYHSTFNPIKNFEFCHCRIGKPERVIIYNLKGGTNVARELF